MSDRLLVPLDGSARAAAILFALDLWARPSEEVLLLQVRPRPLRPRRDGPHVESVEQQARALELLARHYLESVALPLQRRGWRIRVIVRLGEPATEILATAKAEGVRAILVASCIPRGLATMWRGRVLQRLLAQSPMPVVVFHPGRGLTSTAAVVDGRSGGL
jgi:nucleotide-binding universal stress UspA family protein